MDNIVLGFLVLGCVFVLQSSFVACDTNNLCMPGCDNDVRTLKIQYAADLGVTAPPNLSLYIGSNECWDCDQVQLVCNDLRSSRHKRQAYNFTADARRRWLSPISYLFDSNIPSSSSQGSDAKTIIRNAISHIEAQTCIRFNEIQQPITTSYMNFTMASSCVSFVGRTLGSISAPIYAAPGCLSQFGEMLYLVVQTLGLFHASQRYDRDSYISILPQNVFPQNSGDLGIISQSLQLLDTYGLPYDYASLMQFPSTVFSINGNYTIITNDPLYQLTIGQRVQLSFQDSKLLNFMYCSGACSSQPLAGVCQNGGYQDPNNCGRCRCPDGFSGTYCTDLEQSLGATCGGALTVTATEQTISSPGYNTPGYYDPQVKCIWSLTAPVGSRIALRFSGDFGIYCQDESCYHWVEVRYTSQLNVTGPRFCCNNLPSNLSSVSNQVLIIFQSNMSGIDPSARRGFQLAYKLLLSGPAAGSPCDSNPCQNNGTCTSSSIPPNSFTCTCSSPYSGPLCQRVSGPATGSPCDSNPCQNNGTCITNSSSPSSYTCACPSPFSGPLCRRASCGGCQATPGIRQQPCIVKESPERMCNFTTWKVDHSDSTDDDDEDHDGRRWKRGWPRSPRVIQSPCTKSICCDNAVAVGSKRSISSCAVTGWTNCTRCSAMCGGGYSRQFYYSVQETTWNGQVFMQYTTTNVTTTVCGTTPCSCTSRFCRLRPRRSCNPGFSKQDDVCQPTSLG